MERRRFGSSDFEITPVGIGTAPIGSLPGSWWVNWGPQDEGESIRAIHAMDLSPEAVRTDVEGSLRRLGVERLDLLQLHDRDPRVRIEETWGAVLELVAEGKVRYGGISNHRAEEVVRALAVGPVAGLQYEYSALSRQVEDEILPLALERGLGMIVWAPLASGFLTDGFSLDALAPDDFRRTHRFAELDLADLHETLRRDGGTVVRGALRWVLANPAVTGAIVGVRNEREARELADVGSAM